MTKVGEVEYVAGIDTSKLKVDAAKADAIAQQAGDGIGSGIEAGEQRGSAALAKLAGAAKLATAAVGVALAGGIFAAAKASFTQVDAIQQATIALNAYEKDGDKVNTVLKDLVSYARSDLGVLFNRKDLFQSAQNLKLYGDNTENLTSHVKILSRSVGLGLSTWEGLNNVIGRVGSTGRLYADDLQYLQNAGFKLDGSLSGTSQTFESLFSLLDKGIPTDALDGQANTIKGLGVRMSTAFRNVGDAILGVDADTGKFVEGGLGMALTNGLIKSTALLKGFSTTLRDVIPNIQAIVAQVGDYLGPKLQALWQTVTTKLIPAIKNFTASFGPQAGTALVAAIGWTITGLNLLLMAATPLINFLSENTYVVWAMVGAFVAFKAALAISSAISAFQAGLQVANAAMIATTAQGVTATSTMAGLKIALTGLLGPWQVALAIIGVGAVVYGIKQVADALESLMEKWAKAGKVKIGGGIDVNSNSDIGLTQRLMNAFGGFRAGGGQVSAGQSYIVGEKRPELFVPSTNGTIIPEVPTGGSNVSVTVHMSGIMSRSKADERDIAKSLVKRINEELESMHQRPIGGGAIV